MADPTLSTGRERTGRPPAPHRPARALLAVACVVLLVLGLAACGDDDGDASTDTSAAESSAGSTGGTSADDGSDGGSGAPVQLSGTVNDEGTEDISDQGDSATIEIEADDNYFEPTFVKVAPGATVTVEVHNEGDNPHTFSLDDGSPDQTINPGDSASIEVTIPGSGALRFHCDFHESMGMQGAFFIQEGDTVESGSGSGSGGSGGSGGSSTTTAEGSSGGGSTTTPVLEPTTTSGGGY